MIATHYTETENLQQIADMVPQQEPFRFIDRITYADDTRIEGYYHFEKSNPIYKGHCPGYPVTPGVILTEVMAQIGLVAFGLYLLSKSTRMEDLVSKYMPAFTRSYVDFHKQVLPGETVYVVSEKILFRHKKLVCQVKLFNNNQELVASGNLSGFMHTK